MTTEQEIQELNQSFATMIASWRKYSCPRCHKPAKTIPFQGGILQITCDNCKVSWRKQINIGKKDSRN